MEVRIAGSGSWRWAQIAETYSDLLPPFPGQAAVAAAMKPEPPLVPREWAEAQQMQFVSVSVRRAVEHAHGHARGLGDVHVYAALALPFLLELEIAPAAWAAFSCDVWREHVRLARVPPAKWVLSENRICQRTGWFAWARDRFRGGGLYIAPSHARLLAKYRRMRRALLSEAALDWARAQEILDRCFEAGEYARLVAAATAENEAQRERWQRAAMRGEFLW